ncbi:hypothetical protein Z945_232 [Sulfitobacter noctilucae]|nr:hypothetical protein Z945_232 [Sulfitobacter noctilucae]
MRLSLITLALLALGWTVGVFILSEELPKQVTVLVAAPLILAEALSGILCATAIQKGSSTAATSRSSETMGMMLTGWVGLCLVLLTLYHFRAIPLFLGQPFAVLSILAMTLLLALLKLRACSIRIAGRMLVFAAAAKGALALEVTQPELLLALAILIQLGLLLMQMTLGNNLMTRAKPNDLGYRTPGSVVLAQYADTLILPFVLHGPEAFIYLFARGLGLSVTAVLGILCRQSDPLLRQARCRNDSAAFLMMAARLNLGVLLIGGALCLAMLTAGPFLAAAMSLDETPFHTVLMLLLLGAAAPVIFGATDSLLATTGQTVPLLLCDIALITGLSLAALSGQLQTAVFLAQCFAVAHLLKGMIAAFILARFGGVWPGVTALVLRQIELM